MYEKSFVNLCLKIESRGNGGYFFVFHGRPKKAPTRNTQLISQLDI